MLRRFQTVFESRITILQYEDLVGNRSAFSQAVARLIGGDADRIEALLDLPPKNAIRSELFYLYRRFVNKYRSVAPTLDLRSVSAARKHNAAVERWTASCQKNPYHCLNMTALG